MQALIVYLLDQVKLCSLKSHKTTKAATAFMKMTKDQEDVVKYIKFYKKS